MTKISVDVFYQDRQAQKNYRLSFLSPDTATGLQLKNHLVKRFRQNNLSFPLSNIYFTQENTAISNTSILRNDDVLKDKMYKQPPLVFLIIQPVGTPLIRIPLNSRGIQEHTLFASVGYNPIPRRRIETDQAFHAQNNRYFVRINIIDYPDWTTGGVQTIPLQTKMFTALTTFGQIRQILGRELNIDPDSFIITYQGRIVYYDQFIWDYGKSPNTDLTFCINLLNLYENID